jgi:Protein of unknown function (DUF3592)
VVASEVLSSLDTAREDARAASYRLQVTYEYDVAGRRFAGHRVSFGDILWTRSRSKEDVKRRSAAYPPRSKVTVFYDGRHPHCSTLHTSIDEFRFYSTLAVATLFIFGGIAAMLGWVQVR